MDASGDKGVELTDEALAVRMRQGDAAAFDELYQRYSRRLLYYFRRMLGADKELAEDCLHDLFLRVFERSASYDPARRFSVWIFAIAHNVCCNELRRRQVRKRADETAPDELLSPAPAIAIEDELEQGAFKQSLLEELDLLDQNKRSTFLLRFQEGFTVDEIGTMLGCPAGTVKSRLHYTCRLLADRLREHDPRREPES